MKPLHERVSSCKEPIPASSNGRACLPSVCLALKRRLIRQLLHPFQVEKGDLLVPVAQSTKPSGTSSANKTRNCVVLA
eukprot:3214859-Pleurochrysis_carterae.AAC.2